MTAEVEINGQTQRCVVGSGCRPCLFPLSRLRTFMQAIKLKPSSARLRAVNGKPLDMKGTAGLNIRIPGTCRSVYQTVQVAGEGVMPSTIQILGNKFWSKCNASLQWSSNRIKGTTPHGEEFSLPVTFRTADKETMDAAAVVTETGPGEQHVAEHQDQYVAVVAAESIIMQSGSRPKGVKGKAVEALEQTEMLVWQPMKMKMSKGDMSEDDESDWQIITPSMNVWVHIRGERQSRNNSQCGHHK